MKRALAAVISVKHGAHLSRWQLEYDYEVVGASRDVPDWHIQQSEQARRSGTCANGIRGTERLP